MKEYVTTEQRSEEGVEYGIALCCQGRLMKHVPGLTDDIAAARALTALLNGEDVEPCHFEDVVEDFLTDFKV